jgi:uncharacterized protein (DUF433 family)
MPRRELQLSKEPSAGLQGERGDCACVLGLTEPSTADAVQQFIRRVLLAGVIYFLRRHGRNMESVIVKNPRILSGTPVFRGTRVPLQLLFDSLERGHTLEEFLEGYPTVSRQMAIAALEEAQQLLSAKD